MLNGRGGTGKTTIVGISIAELGIPLDQVVFAAPTHKAKAVLAAALRSSNMETRSKVTTVASIVKSVFDPLTGKFKVSLEDELKNDSLSGAKILVVDESSMVGQNDYENLLNTAARSGTRVLFMGDSVQLSPVDNKDSTGKQSPIAPVFKAHGDTNSARLTERMRQGEDSPIVKVTDILAEGVEDVEGNIRKDDKSKLVNLSFDVPFSYDEKEGKGYIPVKGNLNMQGAINEAIVRSFVEDFEKDSDTRFITYNNESHKNTIALTKAIRKARFGEAAPEFVEGEPLMTSGSSIRPSTFNDERPAYISTSTEMEIVEVGPVVTGSVEYIKTIVSGAIRTKTVQALHNVTYQELTVKFLDEEGKYVTEKVKRPISVKVNNKGKLEDFNIKTQKELKDFKEKYGGAEHTFELPSAFAVVFHSYVVNAHKSQGSTYSTVYVDGNNFKDMSKNEEWLPGDVVSKQGFYVAVSRPRRKLVLILDKFTQNANAKNPKELYEIINGTEYVAPEFGSYEEMLMQDMTNGEIDYSSMPQDFIANDSYYDSMADMTTEAQNDIINSTTTSSIADTDIFDCKD